MKELDLIKLSEEAERYPGLLAWYQYAQSSNQDLQKFSDVRWLNESPEAEGIETLELFERYVERGEIGAAQFLQRKKNDLPADRVIRKKTQLAQHLADALLNARDSLLQIKEANVETGTKFSTRLEEIESDPVLLNFRPGWALTQVQAINGELETAINLEREAVLEMAKKLLSEARGNSDVEAAVKKIEELINVPEGLASAARLLDVAKNAKNGEMSADDIRRLYSAAGDGVRLVRTWSELREVIGDSSTPAGLAEQLGKEKLTGALRLPADFDRDKLRDLLLSLSPDSSGAINTERVADRLEGFLGFDFNRNTKQRGSYGTHFPFTITAPRHKEFSGVDRKLFLTVPLRGTDPSAIGQLLKELASNEGGKALSILLYPGVADPSRALAQQLGVAQSELLFIDCIDLFRIAEVPVARRSVALQQVVLPRFPSLGIRTFQTGGPVASELFRGRQGVIDELTSPRGKTVLFSGRMMGKSSVLSRIRDRIEVSHRGSNAHRCVLLSAATGALLDPLMDRLYEFLSAGQKEQTRKDRERLVISPQDKPAQREEKEVKQLALLRWMIEKIIAIGRLTILIDEADKFAKADSARDRRFSMAWLLRDLENHASDKLRIVFAGFQTLHHEVIAANGAFANWFGQCQLGPLEREEAISLIKEPLADFGVQFVSDAGIERILEFTGRYPLLIQEVCARLMKRAMARRQQPIKVGDEVITLRAGEVEMVCRDETLRTRLHQVLSLNLNEYPRLKLVTYLILQSATHRAPGEQPGTADIFRIEDVQAMLVDWYGDKLSEYFSETNLPGLVEELESLGLIAPHGDGYRFLNRTFAAMLRDALGFEEEFIDLLDRVANPRDREPRRYWSLPTEHLETLLRSRSHSLLVGLPATLKSQIVHTLFSRELGSSSLLLENLTVADAKGVNALLRQMLREERKTLSLGDLCVKAKIHVLVLDCPKLPLHELNSISKELSERANIRLVATGDATLAREFVRAPVSNFELVAVRRLRPQDIQSWGEQPYRKQPGGREFDLLIDQKTAAALMSVTCGYFPLLQKFRDHCERVMTRASQYYPSEDQVEGFRREVTPKLVREVLFSSITDVEASVLRRLLDHSLGFDSSPPRIDKDFAQEHLLDEAKDENELTEKLCAVETLLQLDLMTEQVEAGRRSYVFDNVSLLKLAFGI